MTKQPFLTDFPLVVFATAKRSLQAAIRRTSAIITRHSLSGYAVLFEDLLPGGFLASIDPTERQRSFGHIPVFWAWLAQILEANASCQKAVGLVQSWCLASKLPVPSSDTSSYCKARGRLRLSFLQQIHQRVIDRLGSRIDRRDQWNGFTLKAMDGSSVQLMDTPQNQLLYPQPSVQKPGCGFPVMGIVGLVNLGHGGWEHVETCPHTRHDTKAAATLATHLSEGDLLLADRAFCSYELIARCRAQGARILMRLHQARDKALDWRMGRKIGPNERLVTWKRPQQPRGSTMTREEWAGLPASMELRLIRFHYEDRAGNKAELTVVTTLLDPELHAGADLADLYARRWEIELKLRDLKTTLGMERFAVRSPEMAHKTLWMSIIAYNLIRALMQKAAAEAGEPVWHLSFKGVLDLIVSSHESLRVCVGKPRKRREAVARIVSVCATKRIDIRPFRHEPRAVKTRPKSYQYLTAHRAGFIEIQHRGRYRKSA